MKILIDADACPVTHIAEAEAKKRSISVVIFCDTNHVMFSDYSEVRTVGAGADAVDFALVNACCSDDIVITQDYGLASMVLGRGAKAIHQSGMWYTADNIDGLLMQRHVSKKARMASSKSHLKGPSKRTKEDDERFAESFRRLLEQCLSENK